MICSVGWLGSVTAFLALGIAGITSHDAQTVRAAFIAMNVIGGIIIVPLSLLAFLPGIVQSLGTEWGLFRHYWMPMKLILTFAATFLLLLQQFTAIVRAARLALEAAPGTQPGGGSLGGQLVGDAVFVCWCCS